MMEGNVAPKYSPKRSHNRYQHNNLRLRMIELHRKRHLRGAQTWLGLNRIEKDVLVSGIAFVMALSLILVNTKVTNDVYQHQMITVNANISKFRNLNNNSRQRMSDLESGSRLHKIAQKNHLGYSDNSVRNVK